MVDSARRIGPKLERAVPGEVQRNPLQVSQWVSLLTSLTSIVPVIADGSPRAGVQPR